MVDLHRLKQVLKALGAHRDLHDAAGIAALVVGGHANELLGLTRRVVGGHSLYQLFFAAQKLTELVGAIGRVAREAVAAKRGGRGDHVAVAIKHIDRRNLQDVGQLLELLLGCQRGVLVHDVGGHAAFREVAGAVLVLKLTLALGVALDRLAYLISAGGVRGRLAGQGKERLHVEAHRNNDGQAHDRENRGLLANGAVVGHRPQAAELLGSLLARALVVAHDKDAVEGHAGGHHHKDKENDAHRGVSRLQRGGLGNGVDVVGVVDALDAAVEVGAVGGHTKAVAVLKVARIEASVVGIGAHQVRLRVVGDQVVFGRDGDHVAVLPHRDVAQHALGRARGGDKVAQLGGVLLDDHQGVVVDAGGIVAVEPVLVADLDLDGGRGLTRLEDLAQLIEARVGKVGLGVGRLGRDLAVAGHHHNVVDLKQLAVFVHLGVGRGKARVVLGHEGHALGLGLVDAVVNLGVLVGLVLGLGEKVRQARGTLGNLIVVRGIGQALLHVAKKQAARHRRGGDDDK